MKTLRLKTLFLFTLIFSVSACVWDGVGRHDRGHDERGDSHHEHEHGEGEHDRYQSSQRGDDRDEYRYWL